MRILDLSFAIILMATLLRVFISLQLAAPGFTDWLLDASFRYKLVRSGLVFLDWITPVYSLVIGYILWLFGEKKWIIGFSYLYILAFILYRTVWHEALSNAIFSQQYVLLLMVSFIPAVLCSISWFSTRVRPIAPYFWALAGIYLFLNVLALSCELLYASTRRIQWEVVIIYLSVFSPLPTLFIIARTKRWMREERELEREVGRM